MIKLDCSLYIRIYSGISCIQIGYYNLEQCKNRWRRDNMKALNSGNIYAYIFVLMIHGYISTSAPRSGKGTASLNLSTNQRWSSFRKFASCLSAKKNDYEISYSRSTPSPFLLLQYFRLWAFILKVYGIRLTIQMFVINIQFISGLLFLSLYALFYNRFSAVVLYSSTQIYSSFYICRI